MQDSIYRDYGMHKGASNEAINKLTKRFAAAKTRRKRLGLLLGVNFLEQVVADLKAGGYDGLFVKFGIAPGEGGELPTYELVATEVKMAGGDSHEITQRGTNYSSQQGLSTNPPSLPSPPLGGPGGVS